MAAHSHKRFAQVLAKRISYLLSACITCLFSYNLCAESTKPAINKGITSLKNPILSLRARAAHQEQQTAGSAASYRLRLSWQQPLYSALEAKIAFDHIATYWQENHSDGVRFNSMPVIPDTPSTQINEAWISGHWQALKVKIGKQRISLNNQRHIGSNGFWQDEQTFNATQLNYAAGMSTTINLSYLSKAYRITGPQAGAYLKPSDHNNLALNGLRPKELLGEHNLKTLVAALKTTILDTHKVSAYYIDNDNLTAPTLNYRSFGTSYQWKQAFGTVKAAFEADLSLQQRNDINQIPYSRIRGELNNRHWHFALEQEQLGSKSGTAYITPMASLHDFQGFADQFLSTPSQGVTDHNIQARYVFSGYKATVTGHHFTGYSNTQYLGKELDIDIKLPDIYQLKTHLRYAYFAAPSTQQDVQRLFLTISVTL